MVCTAIWLSRHPIYEGIISSKQILAGMDLLVFVLEGRQSKKECVQL